MQDVETDPLVSCPIVCGEYRRATGFFYSTGTTTYLITARHNCLPTDGAELETGDAIAGFKTTDVRPTIDIYLRTADGFDAERIDITEQDGVIQMPEIDVVGVPIEFTPEEYGYQVWDESDITAPQKAGDSLTSTGFNSSGFPDSDQPYDIDMYRNQLGKPVLLPLVNEHSEGDDLTRYGLMPPAIDTEFVGSDDDYNGFSGAPITDNGLVGIHSQNQRPPEQAVDDANEFMLISYSRADLLPKILP